MIKGYTGRWLICDLANKSYEIVEPDPLIYQKFLGGRGVGSYILLNKKVYEHSPLSRENILIFATGPANGTITQTSGRYSASTFSPLTGTILENNSGGDFGFHLKKAGFDALIILNSAEAPVFIEINEKGAIFHEADSLWGKNSYEVLNFFKGRAKSVATIGRAGEKLVKFASIVNEDGHFLARGGIGAVMGSKKLKAVVVNYQKPTAIEIYDKTLFKEGLSDIKRLVVASPVDSKGLSVYGTGVLVNLVNYMRILPVSNFRHTYSPDAFKISGEYISSIFKVKRKGCKNCPIGCKGYILPEKEEIPEYETLSMLGSNIENFNIKSIFKANRMANDYGMDTISLGGTIAAYSEFTGKKFSTNEILDLIEKIGEKNGIGAELSEGSFNFLKKRGKEKLSMSVKRLEIPGYDPRGTIGQGLGYATSNRGACHLQAYMVGPEIFGKPKLIDRLSYYNKSGLVFMFQNTFTAVDSMVICKFLLFSAGEEELANMVHAITGFQINSEEFMRIGERIWNIERLFNIRAGIISEADTLPERFFTEDGDLTSKKLDKEAFLSMLREYYKFRGWNGKGIPTQEKIENLDINRLLNYNLF